eukprot:5459938-Prorocentrum_lima.AAC.1
MTSSLVGSEMCIRDRRAGKRARCRARPSRVLCAEAARSPACRLESLSGSVSYTHLTLPTICSV